MFDFKEGATYMFKFTVLKATPKQTEFLKMIFSEADKLEWGIQGDTLFLGDEVSKLQALLAPIKQAVLDGEL